MNSQHELTDLMEAIVGDLEDNSTRQEPEVIPRQDGSWLIDGGLPVDKLKELLNLRELPGDDDYYTLAGLALAQLGEAPTAGQSFHWDGWRFEVVDMDGQRIEKVLVSPEPELP